MRQLISRSQKSQSILASGIRDIISRSPDIFKRSNDKKERMQQDITQHFAYVHGLLQIRETKLMKFIDQQWSKFGNNIINIVKHLQLYQERLYDGRMLLKFSKDNNLDVQHVLNFLHSILENACYAKYNINDIEFNFLTLDSMIQNAIRTHYQVQTPLLNIWELTYIDTNKKLECMPPTPLPLYSINLNDEDLRDVPGYAAEIMHFNSLSSFYVKLISLKEKYLDLSTNMMEYITSGHMYHIILRIKKDGIYIVKQPKSDFVFRGQVVKLNKNYTYDIYYIDLGVTENCVIRSRIYNIKSEFLQLPAQAIPCTLYNMPPSDDDGEGPEEAQRYFSELLRNSSANIVYIAKIVNKLYYVDIVIHEDHDPSVQQSLSNLGLEYGLINNIENIKNYSKEELQKGKITNVFVSYVNDLDNIYVRKIETNTKIADMMTELNKYYNESPLTYIITNPGVGLPCVVRYDDTWHRCRVIETVGQDIVVVHLVDKGNVIDIESNLLRMILPKFMAYKAQAIKIALMNVKLAQPDYKEQAEKRLKGIISYHHNFQVLSKACEQDTYTVHMNTTDGINVVYLLNLSGLFECPKSELHYKDDWSSVQGRTSDGSFDDSLDKQESESFKKDPFKVEISIKHIVQGDCSLYVTLAEREQSNTKMLSAMQKFYKNYWSKKEVNLDNNTICAVYSAHDECYHRANILKIISQNEILVYLHDLGIQETVNIDNIQNLHPRFATEPAHCFCVTLAGMSQILRIGLTNVYRLLQTILSDKAHCKFYITKVGPFREGSMPVILWLKKEIISDALEPSITEFHSINKMLMGEVDLTTDIHYNQKQGYRKIVEDLKSNCLLRPNSDAMWFNRSLPKFGVVHNIIKSFESDVITWNADIDPPMPKIFDWPPPNKIMDEESHVIATNLNDKTALYIYPKKHAKIINFMESKLQNHMKSIQIKTNETWKEGDLCLARYKNKKWRRGKVIGKQGDKLLVTFVDYGHEAKCKLQDVTKNIIFKNIPIQCTKCVIDGLLPRNDQWLKEDLEELRRLVLNEREFIILIRKREAYNLVVSLWLLQSPSRPEMLNFIDYITRNTNIKLKPPMEDEDMLDETDQDISMESLNIIEGVVGYKARCDAGWWSRSSLESCDFSNISTESTFKNFIVNGYTDIIEGTESERNNSNKIDSESISWTDITCNRHVTSSTPQYELQQDFLSGYKPLIIPREIKYIELILNFNEDTTTSFAQLAENKDDLYSKELHEYYLQYLSLMSDLQDNACNQPVIDTFAKNTSCIAKFVDGKWHRCVITNCQKDLQTKKISISVHYIDYGNHEQKILDMSALSYYIRTPKKEWLKLPAMAIKCKFWAIEFVSDDIYILASRLDKIYNRVAVARVKDVHENILDAEVYKDKTCQELLYASLIDDGLYKLTAEND